jgi:hypothetical protein
VPQQLLQAVVTASVKPAGANASGSVHGRVWKPSVAGKSPSGDGIQHAGHASLAEHTAESGSCPPCAHQKLCSIRPSNSSASLYVLHLPRLHGHPLQHAVQPAGRQLRGLHAAAAAVMCGWPPCCLLPGCCLHCHQWDALRLRREAVDLFSEGARALGVRRWADEL